MDAEIKVTVASLKSTLNDTEGNLSRVERACRLAHREGARMCFLPELMLTGHGAHRKMAENAQHVPDGPLTEAVIEWSRRWDLCICVGIAERTKDQIVYNSQIVVDRGTYIGLQRKINLSGDEYVYFGAGERVEVFDIGELRFGITICYDNHFPELALIHSLQKVDLILAPHAARSGDWPDPLTEEFKQKKIADRQRTWEQCHSTRADDHNVYVLLNNAVGPATEGLENVVANHAGTVMGIDPHGEVFLRTSATDIIDECVTVELRRNRFRFNHSPTRNRRLSNVVRQMEGVLNSRR
jgi:predicted amidohydrolase